MTWKRAKLRGTEKMRMIRDLKRSRVGMTGNRRRTRDHNLHGNLHGLNL